MPKYGDFSGSYFPVFNPSTGKYGPEKTPFLDTFHAMNSENLSFSYFERKYYKALKFNTSL